MEPLEMSPALLQPQVTVVAILDELLATLPRQDVEMILLVFPSPSACEVAERCRRAIEDIPRLLRPPKHPRSVPKVSPVSMELQKVYHTQLKKTVDVVGNLGEVADTVTGSYRGKFLHEPPDSLHEALKNFTQSICKILNHSDVTSLGHYSVPSLGRALAALWPNPGTT
ncbi:uncharacterized protein LOC135291648 isoform X3 [Passer domesticus]|uniref:uncharacterized protein LOC135291648 isoform X3 n=1 Tax=Passer domesticus TaxID=48849 RepID=UPI0030FE32EB